MTSEKQIEESLIRKLKDLKYAYREDIRDKAALEANFREHFGRLNKNLVEIEGKIKEAKDRHNKFPEELGLPKLP